MIIVTGAAGFIGSCMVSRLLQSDPSEDIAVVDDFSRADKGGNLNGKAIRERIPRDQFLSRFDRMATDVRAVIHLGARTDTTEKDKTIFDTLNVHYSQEIWKVCTRQGIPLIYASSAATYGGGEHGYSDDHAGIPALQPLNPYGDSKQTFDLWVMEQEQAPPFWAGIKFFNVYGPNEYHKGRMASVVWHAFRQIRETGGMRLFRSHREGIADGEQQRDFIYVRDVVEVLHFLLEKQPGSGIYNLGTGRARSFLDLTRATFAAMDQEPGISFMDTPADIRDTYQYFTEAEMTKLRAAGYRSPFTELEEGVRDYVRNYLLPGAYF
jgi:ADP-L-glycero-D-manno-heptose 6-epimerase